MVNKHVRVAWTQMHEKAPKTTIEHVLPQGPSHQYWHERFGEDDLRVYTHDIGNLALTEDNSSYGNRPFSDKRGEAGQARRCYARALYTSEQDLAAWDEWTPETIRERRESLIEWARGRWPRPGQAEVDEDALAAEAEAGD